MVKAEEKTHNTYVSEYNYIFFSKCNSSQTAFENQTVSAVHHLETTLPDHWDSLHGVNESTV